MSDNETSHPRAVAVFVGQPVTATSSDYILAIEEVSLEVRMLIYAAIGKRNRYPIALADFVGVSDPQEIKVPLVGAGVIDACF